MAQKKSTTSCCGNISVDVKPGEDCLTFVIKGEGLKKTGACKKIVVYCTDSDEESSE